MKGDKNSGPMTRDEKLKAHQDLEAYRESQRETPTMTDIETANNDAILEALAEDGVDMAELCELLAADETTVAQIIRASATEGCLLWTKRHIVSTHSTCPFEFRF